MVPSQCKVYDFQVLTHCHIVLVVSAVTGSHDLEFKHENRQTGDGFLVFSKSENAHLSNFAASISEF
jgi:hypothetical protein